MKPKKGSFPRQAKISPFSLSLGRERFRALSTLQPVTLYIEPDKAAANAPTDYKFVNETNPAVEANYHGKLNMAGNVMDVLPNSPSSVAVDYFDLAHIELKFKYQYLAMNSGDKNQAANGQMLNAINEAIARVASETYTDLPFFADEHISSLPNSDSATVPSTDPGYISKKYLGTLVWYQTFLQNLGSVMARYEQLLGMEHVMIHMGYNRESATVVDLMGRFKKKAFFAKITSLRHTIMSNYFDKAWWRQVNTIFTNCSRKADSIREPLLLVDAIHEMPTCKIKAGNVTIVDSSTYAYSIDGVSYTFDELVFALTKMMNPYAIIKWARRFTFNNLQANEPENPNEYFNLANALLDGIMAMLGKFSADTSDVKTMLDVANRARMNRWELGVELDVDPKAHYDVYYNKLITNIFECCFGTDHAISFDSKTQRWAFHTLWDEYLGIPEFNKINGGAFLTFSCHDLPNDLAVNDVRNILPIMFEGTNDNQRTAFICDRWGVELQVFSKSYSFNSSPVTNRLKLISDNTFNAIIMPFVNTYAFRLDSAINTIESCALYLLNDLFGYGAVTRTRNPESVDPDHPYLDSDLNNVQVASSKVGFIDCEISDVMNDMIAYYKAYAPLVVYSSTLERTMGFVDTPSFN